jgi:hypothetical protein
MVEFKHIILLLVDVFVGYKILESKRIGREAS